MNEDYFELEAQEIADAMRDGLSSSEVEKRAKHYLKLAFERGVICGRDENNR